MMILDFIILINPMPIIHNTYTLREYDKSCLCIRNHFLIVLNIILKYSYNNIDFMTKVPQLFIAPLGGFLMCKTLKFLHSKKAMKFESINAY